MNPLQLAVSVTAVSVILFIAIRSYLRWRGEQIASLRTPVCPPGRYGPAILASTTILSSEERGAVLATIANKGDLSPDEQCLIVDVLRISSSFGTDTTGVLVSLLSSPVVSESARSKVRQELPLLGLNADELATVGRFLSRRPGSALV